MQAIAVSLNAYTLSCSFLSVRSVVHSVFFILSRLCDVKQSTGILPVYTGMLMTGYTGKMLMVLCHLKKTSAGSIVLGFFVSVLTFFLLGAFLLTLYCAICPWSGICR